MPGNTTGFVVTIMDGVVDVYEGNNQSFLRLQFAANQSARWDKLTPWALWEKDANYCDICHAPINDASFHLFKGGVKERLEQICEAVEAVVAAGWPPESWKHD